MDSEVRRKSSGSGLECRSIGTESEGGESVFKSFPSSPIREAHTEDLCPRPLIKNLQSDPEMRCPGEEGKDYAKSTTDQGRLSSSVKLHSEDVPHRLCPRYRVGRAALPWVGLPGKAFVMTVGHT